MKKKFTGIDHLTNILKPYKVKRLVIWNMFNQIVEGELINFLQSSDHDGIILNAGGYTHTSVALRDCVKAIGVPVVEVHISNISAREEFRHTSLISPVATGCIFESRT